MELQILRLIYNYSIFNKTVDKAFVEKIVEIYISNKGLKDYVKNIIFTNNLHRNLFGSFTSSYDFLNKELLIDFKSMQESVESMNEYNVFFNELEQLIFKNLITAQIILHSLESAIQKKQIDNEKDISIETQLIRESFKFAEIISKKQNDPMSLDFYEFCQLKESIFYYWNLDPAAKLADINSIQTILLSMEPIKKRIPNLYEFIEVSLEEIKLCGYQEPWNDIKGICPTQIFLNGFDPLSWYKLDFYDFNTEQLMKNVTDKYTLDERLSLGLPISHSEYKNALKRLKSKNKFKYKK